MLVITDNKVRKEYKKGQKGPSPLRAPEPGHDEFKDRTKKKETDHEKRIFNYHFDIITKL